MRLIALRLLIVLISTYVTLSLIDRYVSSRLPPAGFVVDWPMEFRPGMGLMLRPNSRASCTDGREYATVEITNSLGFLDREHAVAKSPEVFRLLVLGDSFVEACQTPLAEKFTSLLESRLSQAYPGRRFEVIAMAVSGVGTIDEIRLFDAYGQRFEPDLVLVVFVNNDFADNSALLAAVRNGWHPYHPPRMYLEKLPGSDAYRRIEIDPNFLAYRLAAPPPGPPDLFTTLRPYLGWSGLFRRLDPRNRGPAAWERYRVLLTAHLAEVRGLGGEVTRQLEGWDYPDDCDIDGMFYADPLPQAFQDALETTRFALGAFSRRLRPQRRGLLLVATDSMSFPPSEPPNHRHVRAEAYLERLRKMATEERIPLLDLYAAFRHRGDPREAHWQTDGHWNALGHRWAAEAITEYLAQHPELLEAHDSGEIRG